jgi:hypothetical protein
VNTLSQIKHCRRSFPTVVNTLPIWSLWVEPVSRRVWSSADKGFFVDFPSAASLILQPESKRHP